MKIYKKSGLFLTIELMTVLVISASIVGIAVAGISHGLKMYKIYSITKEYTEYSKAILSFKELYSFYPGDISAAENKGVMINTVIKNNANIVITNTNPQSYSDLFISPETNHIDGRKAQLVFQQLLQSGGVNEVVSANYNLLSQCGSLNSLVKNTIPVSRFATNASWVLGIDSSNSSSADNNMPNGSVIYNNILYPTWLAKPRLVLFNYQNSSSCIISVNQYNTAIISPNIASILDEKLDDGMPSAFDSIIVSENYTGGSTPNGCTEAIPASINPIDFRYKNSSSSTGSLGCVITFMVR